MRVVRFQEIFIAVVLLCCGAALCTGQTAQITGRITDSSDAVLVGAEVTLQDMDTGFQRTAKSNEAGYYVLALLTSAKYRITVVAKGFSTLSRDNVNLEAAEVLRLDFTLQVGQVTETVNVSESVPLLQAGEASYSQLIESKSVTDLPIGGRNISSLLMALGDGVNNKPLTPTGRVGFAGGRANVGPNGTIDGANAGGLVDTGNALDTPPAAEVKEFRLLQNGYSAEYGLSESGHVVIVTNSGTNALHGHLYEYLQNDDLNARNFFSHTVPRLRYNQYGFTVGGPIVKNRAFFYVANQWIDSPAANVNTLTVPTVAERAGDFSQLTTAAGKLIPIYDPSTTRVNPANPTGFIRDAFPGNVILANRIDAIGAKIMALYPSPNQPAVNLAGASNFGKNNTTSNDTYRLTAKLDYQFRSEDRLMLKFVRNPTSNGTGPVYDVPAADPNGMANWSFTHQGLVKEDHNFTPTLIDEFLFQFKTFSYGRAQLDLGKGTAPLGLNGASNNLAFPLITVAGYSGFGFSPQEEAEGSHDMQVLNTLSWFRGAHALKFGGEFRGCSLTELMRQSMSGQLGFSTSPTALPTVSNTGSALASLLLGIPGSGSIVDQQQLDRRIHYFAGFIQDDWKVTSDLTLNLGLRWETTLPEHDANGRLNGFDRTAINPVSGTPGVITFGDQAVYDPYFRNFGPRVGLAWRPFHSRKTVVRAAYGIFYAQVDANDTGLATGFGSSSSWSSPDGGITPPFLLSQGFPAVSTQPLGPGYGAAAPGQSPYTSVVFLDKHRPTSYTEQWNFTIQRELGWNAMAEAGYVASGGHHLFQNSPSVSINQVPDALMGPGNGQARRPFPQFSDVDLSYPIWGNSIYHSLVVRVEKRFSHGVSFLSSYTFSKLIDDIVNVNGQPGGPQDLYNRRAERSLSGSDVPHRARWSVVYEAPFGQGRRWLNKGIAGSLLGGWNVGSNLSLQHGDPVGLTVSPSTNSNSFSAGSQRPNLLRNPALPASQRTLARWFDTSAAVAPPPYTFGNAARALFFGPGFINLDGSLLKNFSVRERYKFQLRIESFNCINHTNFLNPGTALGTASFAVISTAGPSRTNQVAMVLDF